jgi:hypothetical protein
METTSSATQNAKSFSVLDADAAKHVSLQMVRNCFQKAGFSATELTDDKTDKSNVQELQVSLSQATYKNVKVEVTLTLISNLRQKLM